MMTRFRGMIAAELLALAGGLGVGVAWAQQQQQPQEQGPGEKAGSKLDDLGRSIKRGLNNAGDTVREQYDKARASVHNMDVASRVYGRLHWDKSLTGSSLDLDVKNGVATLRGAVPDAKAKLKAVELAEDTVGITRVVDQLTIRASSVSAPDTSTSTTPKP